MGRPLLFVLLFAGMTTAAQAQLWIGPAALEVRAEDGGKPAAGGEVRLEYLDVDPPEGPEPVKLDSRGRAVIGSLAEGRWRLEVSRPGAMTYRAEIEVQRDARPHLINAVQHNVPGAVTMMKVNLARAKGSAVPPPPREIAAKPRRPEPQPEIPAPVPPVEPPVEEVVPVAETPFPKPETPAPAPPAPPQQVPASAAEPLRPPPSLAPPPTPKPEPKKETPPPAPAPPAPAIPQPTPEPEHPAPAPVPAAPPVKPAPEPQPEPKKETPPPVQPPAPAPQRPIPTPVPERPAPAPAPVAPPTPVPAPTPGPPPATRQGSHKDRSCAECKPGESSLSVEVVAPPVAGASGCGEGLRDALMRRDGGAGLPAGCQMLRLELPPNARYIGYRYEVQDGGASADCLAGKDCPAGNARWPMDPLLFRDGTGKTTVSTAFENRSPDRERRAVLTIYFREAGNPSAPRPMLPSRPKQPGRPPG